MLKSNINFIILPYLTSFFIDIHLPLKKCLFNCSSIFMQFFALLVGQVLPREHCQTETQREFFSLCYLFVELKRRKQCFWIPINLH